MGRSAKSRKKVSERPSGLFRQGVSALGAMIARNPVIVGGTTAFLVALFYVSANALWYQPHFHSGAFFSTRDVAYVAPPARSGVSGLPDETIIHIEREGSAPPVQAVPTPVAAPETGGDPVVKRVQSVLRDLDLYDGPVDGLSGPNTRKAIEAYRRTLGLPVTGDIDQQLVEHLGVQTASTGVSSEPRPGPGPRPASVTGDQLVRNIQAGLKAFGNDGIELDGVVGTRTKEAIREFQSLFGLEVTGEPDEALYAKMQEIGLTN